MSDDDSSSASLGTDGFSTYGTSIGLQLPRMLLSSLGLDVLISEQNLRERGSGAEGTHYVSRPQLQLNNTASEISFASSTASSLVLARASAMEKRFGGNYPLATLMGNTRKQRFCRFGLLAFSVLLFAFLVNASLVLFALWRMSGIATASLSSLQFHKLSLTDLSAAAFRLDVDLTMPKTALSGMARVLLNGVEVELRIPAIDSSQQLVRVAVPEFAFGGHGPEAGRIRIEDIKITVNPDYSLNKLIDWLDVQRTSKLVKEVQVKTTVDLEMYSLWVPILLKRSITLKIPLPDFSKASISNGSPYMDMINGIRPVAVEFPQTSDGAFNVEAKLALPEQFIPSFVRIELPHLEFETRLGRAESFGTFAKVILMKSVIAGKSMSDKGAPLSHIPVSVSIANEHRPALATLLSHIRDDELDFELGVRGVHSTAKEPLQRILSEFEMKMPFAKVYEMIGKFSEEKDGAEEVPAGRMAEDAHVPEPASLHAMADLASAGQTHLAHSGADASAKPSTHTFATAAHSAIRKSNISIGLVGLEKGSPAKFKFLVSLSHGFIKTRMHFDPSLIKGRLPPFYFETVLESDGLHPFSTNSVYSTLASLEIEHVSAEDPDFSPDALAFVIYLTITDLTRSVKVAHKIYHLEKICTVDCDRADGHRLASELKGYKSLLLTGRRRQGVPSTRHAAKDDEKGDDLVSWIVKKVFEIELPLNQEGYMHFRHAGRPRERSTRMRSKKASRFSIDHLRISAFEKLASKSRRRSRRRAKTADQHSLATHDVKVIIADDPKAFVAKGIVRVGGAPILKGSHISASPATTLKIYWQEINCSLYPSLGRDDKRRHLSKIELIRLHLRRGSMLASVSDDLAGGGISLRTGKAEFAVSMDRGLRSDNLIKAWRHVINTWSSAFDDQYTPLVLSGAVGKGKFTLSGIIPTRRAFIKAAKAGKRHGYDVEKWLTAMIRTRLKIVGFKESTLQTMLALPDVANLCLPIGALDGTRFTVRIQIPKFETHLCVDRRSTERHSHRDIGCVAKATIDPVEVKLVLVNGSLCDFSTRLLGPADNAVNHRRRLRRKYRSPIDSLIKASQARGRLQDLHKLLPMSVTLLDIHSIILLIQDALSNSLANQKIMVGRPLRKSARRKMPLLSGLLGGIGEIFPVKIPQSMPQKSTRRSIPKLVEKDARAARAFVKIGSKDRSKLWGAVRFELPRRCFDRKNRQAYSGSNQIVLYKPRRDPYDIFESSLEDEEDGVGFKLPPFTIEWGTSAFELSYGDYGHFRVFLRQGRIALRLSDGRVAFEPVQEGLSKVFELKFDLETKIKDLSSAAIRRALTRLRLWRKDSNKRHPEWIDVRGKELLFKCRMAKYYSSKDDERLGKSMKPRRDVMGRVSLETKIRLESILIVFQMLTKRFKSGQPSPGSIELPPIRADIWPLRSRHTEPVIEVPCIIPAVCGPLAMSSPPKSVDLLAVRIKIHHMFQWVADRMAHFVGRALSKLWFKRHPRTLELVIDIPAVKIRAAFNGIDTMEVQTQRILFARSSQIIYPGMEEYSQERDAKVVNDSEFVDIRIRLPEAVHDIPRLLVAYSTDPALKPILKPLPEGHSKPLYYLPFSMGLTTQYINGGKGDNLLATIACALAPERVLHPLGPPSGVNVGGMASSKGKGNDSDSRESETRLLQATREMLLLEFRNIPIPNPAGDFTVHLEKAITVYVTYNERPFVRVTIPPTAIRPGTNYVTMRVSFRPDAHGTCDPASVGCKADLHGLMAGAFGGPFRVAVYLRLLPSLAFKFSLAFRGRVTQTSAFDSNNSFADYHDAHKILRVLTGHVFSDWRGTKQPPSELMKRFFEPKAQGEMMRQTTVLSRAWKALTQSCPRVYGKDSKECAEIEGLSDPTGQSDSARADDDEDSSGDGHGNSDTTGDNGDEPALPSTSLMQRAVAVGSWVAGGCVKAKNAALARIYPQASVHAMQEETADTEEDGKTAMQKERGKEKDCHPEDPTAESQQSFMGRSLAMASTLKTAIVNLGSRVASCVRPTLAADPKDVSSNGATEPSQSSGSTASEPDGNLGDSVSEGANTPAQDLPATRQQMSAVLNQSEASRPHPQPAKQSTWSKVYNSASDYGRRVLSFNPLKWVADEESESIAMPSAFVDLLVLGETDQSQTDLSEQLPTSTERQTSVPSPASVSAAVSVPSQTSPSTLQPEPQPQQWWTHVLDSVRSKTSAVMEMVTFTTSESSQDTSTSDHLHKRSTDDESSSDTTGDLETKTVLASPSIAAGPSMDDSTALQHGSAESQQPSMKARCINLVHSAYAKTQTLLGSLLEKKGQEKGAGESAKVSDGSSVKTAATGNDPTEESEIEAVFDELDSLFKVELAQIALLEADQVSSQRYFDGELARHQAKVKAEEARIIPTLIDHKAPRSATRSALGRYAEHFGLASLADPIDQLGNATRELISSLGDIRFHFSFRNHAPWTLSLITLKLNLVIPDNDGYWMEGLERYFPPQKLIYGSVLITPKQCKEMLKGGQGHYSDIDLLKCSWDNIVNAPVVMVPNTALTGAQTVTADIRFSSISGLVQVGDQKLFRNGFCASIRDSFVLAGISDESGGTFVIEVPLNMDRIAQGRTSYCDPCGKESGCLSTDFVAIPKSRIWRSWSQLDMPFAPMSEPKAGFGLALDGVTRKDGPGAFWNSSKLKMTYSWTIDVEFRINPQVDSNDGFLARRKAQPTKNLPGLAFVLQAIGPNVVGHENFGYLGIGQSLAITIDPAASSMSVLIGGMAKEVHTRVFGAFPYSIDNGEWHRAIIRYFPAEMQIIVQIQKIDSEAHTSVHTTVFPVDIQRMLEGAPYAYFGVTTNSKDYGSMYFRKLQINATLPELTNARLAYDRSYWPIPFERGSFILELYDYCNRRIIQSPKRLSVRLRRVREKDYIWSRSLYRHHGTREKRCASLYLNPPAILIADNAKMTLANAANWIPPTNPDEDVAEEHIHARELEAIPADHEEDVSMDSLIADRPDDMAPPLVQIEYLPNEGRYRVYYTVSRAGRYLIELALDPNIIFNPDSPEEQQYTVRGVHLHDPPAGENAKANARRSWKPPAPIEDVEALMLGELEWPRDLSNAAESRSLKWTLLQDFQVYVRDPF